MSGWRGCSWISTGPSPCPTVSAGTPGSAGSRPATSIWPSRSTRTCRRPRSTGRSSPPGGALVVRVEFFDVFHGAPVADGRRSLAYRVRLQSPDRTLTEDDLATVRRAVIDAVEASLPPPSAPDPASPHRVRAVLSSRIGGGDRRSGTCPDAVHGSRLNSMQVSVCSCDDRSGHHRGVRVHRGRAVAAVRGPPRPARAPGHRRQPGRHGRRRALSEPRRRLSRPRVPDLRPR